MRIIVTGGRHSRERNLVWNFMDTFNAELPPTEELIVIQGGAGGVDKFAREWCMARAINFVNYPYPPGTGRSGGPIRNLRMILDGKPELTLAFPGGKGTANMIRQSRERGVKVLAVSSDGTIDVLEPYPVEEQVS